MQENNILIWLPSPLGDAVLCTPVLRAIRRHFKSDRIFFFANPVVKQILSPCEFNDEWLEQRGNNPFTIAALFKKHNFKKAILFKNSIASALACFLAGIPHRIGYSRECRGFLLTERLYPPKLSITEFKPASMIDYYSAIATKLGADVSDRSMELCLEPRDSSSLKAKLPQLFNTNQPIVVLVPGGGFGPSKCWLAERFAQTADYLVSKYNAIVVISVAPNPMEQQIAKQICTAGKNNFISLADIALNLGELKTLFSLAQLVITNDTGPRHIAIALKRKVITLFGPNNPAWTDTGYQNEIQIVGQAHCVPCRKPVCKAKNHFCMEFITVDMVCKAAEEMFKRK